jgi:hypothetical protein
LCYNKSSQLIRSSRAPARFGPKSRDPAAGHNKYEVAINDNIPLQDRLDGIDKINDPWAEGPCEVNVKCLWCCRLGHATHCCQMLHQCVLCWGKGHLEEQCKWPHAKCIEGKICRVNPDHVNWHKMLCRATVKVCDA